MSTNSECSFIQWDEGEWYYILEHRNAPKNAWDWREYATAYGPFKSEEKAQQHLHDHHANPGGYSVDETPCKDTAGEVLTKLVAEAKKPRPRSGFGFYA